MPDGVESVRPERIPPQAVPKPKAPRNACLDAQEKRGLTPGPQAEHRGIAVLPALADARNARERTDPAA